MCFVFGTLDNTLNPSPKSTIYEVYTIIPLLLGGITSYYRLYIYVSCGCEFVCFLREQVLTSLSRKESAQEIAGPPALASGFPPKKTRVPIHRQHVTESRRQAAGWIPESKKNA